MDDPGAIVFSSSDKRGHEEMLYSDVTNPRECPVKKLSISWIVQKLNINERTHVQLRHGKEEYRGKEFEFLSG